MMATAWRSKWLDWKPEHENISPPPETALTELTKTDSVSFVSTAPETDKIIAAAENSLMDDSWGEWLLERCVYIDGWWSGVGCLQFDLACWCASHERPVPSSRRSFEIALLQEGFIVTADDLVYGLALKEDALAHARFQQA